MLVPKLNRVVLDPECRPNYVLDMRPSYVAIPDHCQIISFRSQGSLFLQVSLYYPKVFLHLFKK